MPIGDAPSIYKRKQTHTKLQELIDEANTAIAKISGLSFAIVAGAEAEKEIEIEGIATADEILAVLHFEEGSKLLADLAAETTIPKADNIELGETETKGDTLLVIYRDVSG